MERRACKEGIFRFIKRGFYAASLLSDWLSGHIYISIKRSLSLFLPIFSYLFLFSSIFSYKVKKIYSLTLSAQAVKLYQMIRYLKVIFL